MNLRLKIILTISFTLAVGILAIMLFSFTLLTDSYDQFERGTIEQNTLRGIKALDYEEYQVKSVLADWGRWDETYTFVQDLNDEYVFNNLNYASVENLGVDFLIFLREDNSLKSATRLDATNLEMVDLSDTVLSPVLSIPDFFVFSSLLDSNSGLIILPEGPALVASGPVITSTYDGPAKGTIVLGLFLNSEKIALLSDKTDLPISLIPMSEQEILVKGIKGMDNMKYPSIEVYPASDSLINGTTLLPTIDSNGYVQFQISTSRDILRQGKGTIATFIISLLLLGIVVLLSSLFAIDRLVLFRLNEIIERIKDRNRSREEIKGFIPSGDDELSELAKVIDPVFLELKHSKDELQDHIRLLTESEKKFRELADSLPEFVFEFDNEGKISFLNKMGLQVSEYTVSDLTEGLNVRQLIDPSDHERLFSNLKQILKGVKVSGQEYLAVKKRGDTFPIVAYSTPILSDGSILGFRGFAIDITERLKTESSIRKLANIVEHTRTGLVTGTGQVVDFVNPAYLMMHGYESDEICGNHPFDIIQNAQKTLFSNYLMEAHQSGHVTFELDHGKKDGSIFPALHDLTVLSGDSSDNFVWILNVQDITEHRLAWRALIESEALRESARQLKEVIARLPDATFVIDKDGWVIFWNQGMELLTGIHEEEIVGRGKYEYSVPFFGEKRPMLLNMILEKEKDFSHLYPNAKKTGDSLTTEEAFPGMEKGGKYFSTMASPLYDSRGNVIGAIQSMRDITSRIMAEQALLKTNEKLNLLSSISRHDIRNRITVLLGLLPLLKDASSDPEILDVIRLIETSTRSIHDQIEFTRLYQDLGIQSPIWADVGVLVQKASEIGIPDTVTIHNSLIGVKIYADPLLERVFYNLIDNALRHGGPRLSTIAFSWRLDGDQLVLYCENDGQGIPEDLKETIFERGYGSNTGLGLFLVREILSLTGIMILETCNSELGVRFEIRVPYGGYNIKE